jgi:hypothetical protein
VFIVPDEVIAVRNLHQTLVHTGDEEAAVILRDATTQFGPKIGDLQEAEKKIAPSFDYNNPEVM